MAKRGLVIAAVLGLALGACGGGGTERSAASFCSEVKSAGNSGKFGDVPYTSKVAVQALRDEYKKLEDRAPNEIRGYAATLKELYSKIATDGPKGASPALTKQADTAAAKIGDYMTKTCHITS